MPARSMRSRCCGCLAGAERPDRRGVTFRREKLSEPLPSVRGTGLISPDQGGGVVLIDCDSCSVRGSACGGCFVAALLGGPPPQRLAGVDPGAHGGARDGAHERVREVAYAALGPEERSAVDALRAGGLLAEPAPARRPGRPASGRPAARTRRAG